MPQQKRKPRPRKSCSPARLAALSALESVLTDGASLLDALPTMENQCVDARDLGLARDIASGTCRWWGRIRHILLHLAPRLDNFPPSVQRILEMSVYQILYLDRVPEYAVLSDAVELTRERKCPGLTSPVNGILRNVTRKRDDIPFPKREKDFLSALSIGESHPKWLIQQWLNIWPQEDVESLCAYNNTQAPLSLRVRSDVNTALESLKRQGIEAEADLRFPGRIVLDPETRPPQELFHATDWTVQDGAAMLIAPLLDPKPGWRIWDVCAAPGGKTLHLSDLTEGRADILASDCNEARLKKLSAQIDKLKLTNITTKQLDALQERLPLEGEKFDAILVDAPCSGWGTFRRHPDLRWRLQNTDSKKFGKQALRVLENAQQYLKSNGIMVYSTCTISPDENERVVHAFLERHPNFSVESVEAYLPEPFRLAQTEEGFLFVFPPQWKTDGAFAARLRKGN